MPKRRYILEVKSDRAGREFLEAVQREKDDLQSVKMMLTIGEIIAGEIARQVKDFTSASKGRKTGTLMRSFRPVFKDGSKLDEVKVEVGSPHPGAGKLHVGGLIRPKAAKNLAIPLNINASLLNPREASVEFCWPIFMKTGTKMLVDKATGKPMYVLKPSVNLKGPYIGYLQRAADAASPKITKFVGKGLHTVIVKAAQKAETAPMEAV